MNSKMAREQKSRSVANKSDFVKFGADQNEAESEKPRKKKTNP